MNSELLETAFQLLLDRSPSADERRRFEAGDGSSKSLQGLVDEVVSGREHAELARAGRVRVLAGSTVAEVNLPRGTESADGDQFGFDAIVGSEGRLFIAHGANDFLAQYKGTYELSANWLPGWLTTLEDQEAAAARLGVTSVALVVPDKLAVYEDQFPGEIGRGEGRPISALQDAGARLLYPVKELREGRQNDETYLYTDSHVNLRGAEIIYQCVMNELGLKPAPRIRDAECEVSLGTGDLGVKFSPSPVELASAGPPVDIEVVEDNAPAILAVGGHIGVRQVVQNPRSARTETVVIFGDSYSRLDEGVRSNFGGFIARDFREVHFVWAPFCWDSGYVEKVGATIVIRQMAERFAVTTPKAETDVVGLADETIRRKSAVLPDELASGLQPLNICTIIARNYLAHARVLAESFQAYHPGGKCVLLVIDDDEGVVGDGGEPFTVVNVADLAVEGFDRMKAAYGVTELSTALKPWLLRHMLEHHDNGGGVAYLDPDIRIYSRMVELEEALASSSLVLTPHLTAPIPRDGRTPAEVNILVAGTYNLGFIGLRSTEQAQALLDWWEERLLRDCVIDPERGLFVDQRWVDLMPGMFPDFASLRSPGYNVAYWNLPARKLTKVKSGYEVDGEPLRFFHFSGFDRAHPDRLSQHQNRVVLSEQPALNEICGDYAEALKAAGSVETSGASYGFSLLPSGMGMNALLRGLYREGSDLGELEGDLSTLAAEAEFVAWLNEPVAPVRGVRAPHYTRYLDGLWRCRPDLRSAYPDPREADAEGFAGWCWVFGRPEVPIDDRLLPPEPRGLAGSRSSATQRPHGVNVAGYFRAELGVGEAARQLVNSLDAGGVLNELVTLDAPESRQGHGSTRGGTGTQSFPINIVCVNADVLPQFAEEVGTEFFADRYSIGVWWWELDQFPERFHDAFAYLDEIWVGSRFVADAIAPVSPIPVLVMPVALDFPEVEPLTPGEFGIPGSYKFLYSYDYGSVFGRKNPLGAIDAYLDGFAPGDGAALVLKSINADRDPANHRLVLEAVAGRPDIVIIDEYLDPVDKNRLTASCDCYLSLHRSEGFGLTIAEAMYFGKPVIATGYGGNLEFMEPSSSMHVPHEMVPVGPGSDPYPPEAEWAEPNLGVATKLMREVFENQQAASELGRRGRASIREAHSPHSAGVAMARRLARVSKRLESGAIRLEATGGGSLDLARLISRGYAPTTSSRFGKLGSLLRRSMLRIAKPITAYQERVNQQLFELMSAENATAVEREARTAAEVRRLEKRLLPPERLVAESRAVPYMADDAYEMFEAAGAGRVYGYTGNQAGAVDRASDQHREFEDLFRGEEAFVAQRQQSYLGLIDGQSPVIDLGCGRGEFLDLLAETNVDAVGVDSDAGMVSRCREKGHSDVVHDDAIAYLRSLGDGSAGTIFSAQLIEHLPYSDLMSLFEIAAQKLRPGGLLIAETVNPHSAQALKAFWVDPTHHHPLFPEVMLAIARSAGFGSAFVFHPNGRSDFEADRFREGEYAVVARR
jgi:SAM-dependent methyltransferase/glycosyltransferase involved in cell wall biosynthesis